MTKAFCPGNASCIFRIVENKDRTKRHSLGVGFTVDKGVIVNVGKSDKTEVFANGRKIRFPTVLTVIKELTQEPVKVEIKDQLPSGAGFGISGASALATAYALNELLNLKKSKKIIDNIKKINKKIFLIGFKAEYNVSEKELVDSAYNKLKEADCDLIMANDVGKNPFGSETNDVFVVNKDKKITSIKGDKRFIANKILDLI